jgi:hypothetical protein
MGGWMDGWVEVKAFLRIAYSNKKSEHSNMHFRQVYCIKTLISVISTTSKRLLFGYN